MKGRVEWSSTPRHKRCSKYKKTGRTKTRGRLGVRGGTMSFTFHTLQELSSVLFVSVSHIVYTLRASETVLLTPSRSSARTTPFCRGRTCPADTSSHHARLTYPQHTSPVTHVSHTPHTRLPVTHVFGSPFLYQRLHVFSLSVSIPFLSPSILSVLLGSSTP